MLLGISLDMKNDQITVTQPASFFPAKAIWDLIKGENKLSSTQIIFKLMELAMNLISDSLTSSPS